MIRKSIPPDVAQPPSSLLPHRLDKPVHTTTSRTYADILKQQFSLAPNTNTTTNDHNRPPRKRQAAKFDYDSDQSTEFPATPTANNINNSNGTTTNTPTLAALISAFANDMMLLKNELTQLKDVIATAVVQIKDAITALIDANRTTPSYVTPTDADHNMDSASAAENLTPLDIQSFIYDLKHELATLFTETRVMIQHQTMTTPTNNKNLQSKT